MEICARTSAKRIPGMVLVLRANSGKAVGRGPAIASTPAYGTEKRNPYCRSVGTHGFGKRTGHERAPCPPEGTVARGQLSCLSRPLQREQIELNTPGTSRLQAEFQKKIGKGETGATRRDQLRAPWPSQQRAFGPLL